MDEADCSAPHWPESRRRRRLIGALVALGATAACARDALPPPAATAPRDQASGDPVPRAPSPAISFALLGDVPYRASEVANLPALLADVSAHAQFAIHVGDIKSGIEPCSDQLLAARINALSQIGVPLVYTPGDNEWTDCWRGPAGEHDPMERLAWLRKHVFSGREPLLGRFAGPPPFSGLLKQSEFGGGLPENLLWQVEGIVFITLNVPGSDHGRRAPIDESEHRAREDANRRWLDHALSVAAAVRAPCLAIAIHANPEFGRGLVVTRPLGEDSYAGFRRELARLLERFPGHVLLMHGDTHRFRVNRITPRLTRVESFGSPFSSAWVRISIRPGDADPFSVETRGL